MAVAGSFLHHLALLDQDVAASDWLHTVMPQRQGAVALVDLNRMGSNARDALRQLPLFASIPVDDAHVDVMADFARAPPPPPTSQQAEMTFERVAGTTSRATRIITDNLASAAAGKVDLFGVEEIRQQVAQSAAGFTMPTATYRVVISYASRDADTVHEIFAKPTAFLADAKGDLAGRTALRVLRAERAPSDIPTFPASCAPWTGPRIPDTRPTPADNAAQTAASTSATAPAPALHSITPVATVTTTPTAAATPTLAAPTTPMPAAPPVMVTASLPTTGTASAATLVALGVIREPLPQRNTRRPADDDDGNARNRPRRDDASSDGAPPAADTPLPAVHGALLRADQFGPGTEARGRGHLSPHGDE
jgi:hypothetical protein